MAKKARIELELETGNASEALKEIAKAFEELEASADTASGKIKKGEKGLKGFGKAAKKIKKQIDDGSKATEKMGGKFRGVGTAAKGAAAALGIAVTAVAAATVAFNAFMGMGKEAALALRGEFDPLVAALDAVDNEFTKLKGSIGDIELAAETAIKQAMIPAWALLQDEVESNKGALTRYRAEAKALSVSILAFLVNTVAKGVSTTLNYVETLGARVSLQIMGAFLAVNQGMQALYSFLPDFISEKEIAELERKGLIIANLMDPYVAQIAGADAKTEAFHAKVDALTLGFANLGDKAGDAADKLAASAGRSTGITRTQFLGLLNSLQAALKGPLQAAYEKSFLGGGMPEDMKKNLAALQAMVGETNRVSQAVNLLSESADPTLFKSLVKEVQALYDAAKVPFTLKIPGALKEAEKIEFLRKALELLKIEGEITAEVLGRELGLAMEKAAATGGTATDKLKAHLDELQAHTKSVAQAMTFAMTGALSNAAEAFGTFVASANDATMTVAERQKELAKSIGMSFLGIFEQIMGLMIQKKIMVEAFAASEIATSSAVTVAKVADAGTQAAADIAPAATGAVKSQSWIPAVGPWLGIAAALMVVGFMKGIIGGMAEGGFVPGSWGAGGGSRADTVPKFLTPGEYVMPADEQRGLNRYLSRQGVAPTPNRRGAPASQNINLTFSSTIPANRTEAKKIMQRDIVPLLRSLRSGGY